eukprot:scaffold113763_cov37-Attheya_sp.AAC.1
MARQSAKTKRTPFLLAGENVVGMDIIREGRRYYNILRPVATCGDPNMKVWSSIYSHDTLLSTKPKNGTRWNLRIPLSLETSELESITQV